jgi:CHAT domain-containing protein
MKRLTAALLLLALSSSGRRVQPETLYAQGRDALLRGRPAVAERIARDGERRFAAQAYWRELFTILEAESVIRTNSTRAQEILKQTRTTGAPLPKIRRLMLVGSYEEAAKLAAKQAPKLVPEIAMRRLQMADRDETVGQFAQQAINGATALKQTWIVAAAYGTLGQFNASKERWDDAIADFNRALHIGRSVSPPLFEARSLVNLGWAYLEIGDYEQALPYLLQGLNLARRDSDTSNEHTALTHIADIYEHRIELRSALSYARQALVAAQQPKDLANSYHQLAQIHLELGHYDVAGALNAEARTWRKDAGENEAYEHFIDARLLAANGNPAAAIPLFEELQAACYGKLDDGNRWRAEGLEAETHAKLGHFAAAERMYEAMLDTETKARSRIKGVTALPFERNVLGFYDDYIDLLLAEDRKDAALLVAERSRARLLKEKIGDSSDAAEVDVIDLRELARRKNATILYYWLGATRSLLWTVTPHGIEVARLDPDDVLDRAAIEYRSELQTPRRDPLRSKVGAELYEKLIVPAKVVTRRVIILADSHLNELAFEALIVPEPTPHYWIQDVTISYSPSLHLLAGTQGWKPVRNARLLVFGEVPAAPGFPKLTHAGDEIANVVQHFDPSRCSVVRGDVATPASYLGSHPEMFQFIHFAAHGAANANAPLESSVILARGALSGREIIDHRLTAELVTVSSCNSAGGRSYAGEGLVGLAWAFLGAGAHRVVAAQWEVSESTAPGLMKTMYDEIARGAEPAEALRTAKLELLQSKDELNHRPAFWAPFVIYEAM